MLTRNYEARECCLGVSMNMFWRMFMYKFTILFTSMVRDAIIKENPVKSGFLQITLTPPPPKTFWIAYFLACPDFQIYPPPWFSGTSGFYIAKFHV